MKDETILKAEEALVCALDFSIRCLKDANPGSAEMSQSRARIIELGLQSLQASAVLLPVVRQGVKSDKEASTVVTKELFESIKQALNDVASKTVK